ncbi:MAG: Ig-like domain-containing protein [Mycobacterium sp.]
MTTSSAARALYAGRVGALAAALGAGMVIAGTAVAAGDTGSSDQAAAASQPGPGRAVARTARTPASPASATRTATRSAVFARKPALNYDAATNTQGPGGVITGALNGSQRNGYRLSYSVPTPPSRGTASVGGNGDFTYTPTTEFATLGGTDTFTVTADDLPDNPRHAHGLAALTPSRGHTVSQSVTVLENPGAPLPPSVLATPEQLAAERLATRLADSPAVQIAGLMLKAGWIKAARNNFDAVGGPDATNMARLDQAVTEYANQAALEVQLLDSANPKVIQQVSPPHNWYQQSFAGSRIWYDNPDTIYRFIGVNSASAYVLTGRFDGSLPADTNFSVLTGLGGTTASNLNGRDLVLNPDGSFTITASSAPSAPGETNHLQLAPGTTLITTRNTLADWNSEGPMSLSVSKVSGPRPSLFSQLGGFAFPGIGPAVAASPVLTSLVSLIPPLPVRPVQSLETAAIMLLLGISGEDKYMAVATTDPKTGQRRPPNVLSDPDRNAEFLATQLQSAGYFQLNDDQALVVTIDPGNARYFNVPVTDDWTITDNYWDQQTSLNKSQSAMNQDGTYTFVISKTDPAVANWVSTGGLNQGTVSIRFQDLDTSSTKGPTVQSQVVPIGDLGTVLPAGTQYVTPEQRRAQIAQRQLGYNRRYAPYPQA